MFTNGVFFLLCESDSKHTTILFLITSLNISLYYVFFILVDLLLFVTLHKLSCSTLTVKMDNVPDRETSLTHVQQSLWYGMIKSSYCLQNKRKLWCSITCSWLARKVWLPLRLCNYVILTWSLRCYNVISWNQLMSTFRSKWLDNVNNFFVVQNWTKYQFFLNGVIYSSTIKQSLIEFVSPECAIQLVGCHLKSRVVSLSWVVQTCKTNLCRPSCMRFLVDMDLVFLPLPVYPMLATLWHDLNRYIYIYIYIYKRTIASIFLIISKYHLW